MPFHRKRGAERRRHQREALGAADADEDENLVTSRLVRKYCGCLRGALRLETQRHDGTAFGLAGTSDWLVLRLRGEADTDDETVWKTVREKLDALTILSLLASTRSFSWRHHSRFWARYCPDLPTGSRNEEQAATVTISTVEVHAPRDDWIMPRFVLDFSFLTINHELLKLCRRSMTGCSKSMRIGFLKAMEILSSIHRRHSRPQTVQVCMRFSRCRFAEADAVTDIFHLIETVNACKAGRGRELSRATTMHFNFQVVSLDLGSNGLSREQFNELATITSGYRGGIQILSLDRVLVYTASEAGCPSALAPALAALFDAIHHRSEPEPECEVSVVPSHQVSVPGQLRVLSLNWNSLTNADMMALFSAVHASGTYGAQSLSLRGAMRCCDLTRSWLWLFFGILHPQSTSRLQHLDVSDNTMQHADILEALASLHRGDLKWMLDCQTSGSKRPRRGNRRRPSRGARMTTSDLSHQRARLRKDTCLYLRDDQSSPTFELQRDAQVVVIVARDDALSVLIPGAGVFWVHPEDLEVDTDNDVGVDGTAGSSLTSLAMNGMLIPELECRDASFVAFFGSSLVRGLTRLELRQNPIRTQTLQTILASCPQLEHLDVEECELTSIEPLIRAYASGECKIASLDLADNDIGGREVLALARLMVDDSSPASRIRFLSVERNPIGRQGLHALNVMLRQNLQLERLLLDHAEDPDLHFRRAFQGHCRERIRVEALTVEHKIAFLQVLRRRMAREAVEAPVVRAIFAYAGSWVHRHVEWL